MDKVARSKNQGPHRVVYVTPCLRCGKLTANLKKECRRCLDRALEYVRFGRSK